jgi:hypothetical protein
MSFFKEAGNTNSINVYLPAVPLTTAHYSPIQGVYIRLLQAIIMRNEFNVVSSSFWSEPRICGFIPDHSVIDPIFSLNFVAAQTAKIRLFLGPNFDDVFLFDVTVAKPNLRLLSKTSFMPFTENGPLVPVSRSNRRSEIPPSRKLKNAVANPEGLGTYGTFIRHGIP